MHISVQHLDKDFGQERVLADISLELEGGTVFGLRGKNGSGKTMLLRCLCGLVIPTSGCIVVDGRMLGEDGFEFPPSVGVLIEQPGTIRSYSGLHYLTELARIRGVATEDKIVEYMMRLGLDPLSRKPIRAYSLGMRQKIGIIAALMEKPQLVLLDEPLNALDEASVAVVCEMVREAADGGALVVVASHDREELDAIADVIVEMRAGGITSVEGRDVR